MPANVINDKKKKKRRAAVAQWVELVDQWSEGQLAPCGATTAISKGPAMSWRLIQGLRPWVELDLAPVSPATPQGDKKRKHSAILTEKREKKERKNDKTKCNKTTNIIKICSI